MSFKNNLRAVPARTQTNVRKILYKKKEYLASFKDGKVEQVMGEIVSGTIGGHKGWEKKRFAIQPLGENWGRLYWVYKPLPPVEEHKVREGYNVQLDFTKKEGAAYREGKKTISTYRTRSGTSYSIDEEGYMIRNGEVFTINGEKFRYAGIADHPNAQKTVDDDSISVMRGSWGLRHLLYVIYCEGRLEDKRIPFTEVAKHINGRNMLVFVNDKLEELFFTTPLQE